MKLKFAGWILSLLLLASTAVAGPFRTVIIVGTGAAYDYTLTVPSGKAATITSFLQFNQAGQPNDVASITVETDNPVPNSGAIRLLYSASPDATATQKDLTIAGPAKVHVNVPHTGYQALLTYKLFAN